MFEIDKYLELLKSEKMKRALKVQNGIIQICRDFLQKKGFVEILPVIISPITDPLTDFRVRGEIECYGFKYQITKSMIFHKQISLLTLPCIFSFSPNVRIESSSCQHSSKHLIEFVQLDIEVKEATREDLMSLCEQMLIHLFQEIKSKFSQELEFFQRELNIPSAPFAKFSYQEALANYGSDYENKLSSDHQEPIWIIDFSIKDREFYDRENLERPGILVDMDLIYPEGYGEALSGGEREFELEKIKRRIELKGIDLKVYEIYLKFAARGLFPSAGFGIGIERLTRFICGLDRIDETRLFAKLPGILGL